MAARRRRLAAVVVVLGAAAAALAWTGSAQKRRHAVLSRQDLVRTVEVEGVLRSLEAVTIGPPAVPDIWSFKVSFLVPEGTEVRAGEPVVGFDTTEVQQSLQDKLGERDSAAKELEKRGSELEIEGQDLALELAESRSHRRRNALELEVPPELVARQELETTRVEHALAEAEIVALERRLAQLKLRAEAELRSLRGKRDRAAERVGELQRYLAAMEVKAPRAGTVVYELGEAGEKSKVGDSVWRAQNVLEIPDLRRMVAEGKVDEAEMGRLRPAQRVQLRLDALPDETLRGTVRAVSKAVESRSASDPARVVKVQIGLAATDPARLRPGMRFRGEVEVERVRGVLCLPLSAVDPRPGAPTVTVVRGLGSARVTPRLGRRDDKCIEVLSGLEAGDQVLLPAGTRR
ncbi:MAG TPA: HlyD family efflux transporter periplasmic adaptor subunit [Thermoanaerobaculia bacterium]|nr:HlyD family efflux transporter periplasmic adaptor subunit [Thermoanaerobaculia bacterium]